MDDDPLSTRSTATILTPSIRGAIATIAVQGPAIADRIAPHFRAMSDAPLTSAAINQIVFGVWSNSNGTQEDVVVARRSLTFVEIHCHGGSAAQAAILHTLGNLGVELTEKLPAAAPVGRPLSESQRQAYSALPKCATRKTAAILLSQANGALDQTVQQVIANVESDNPAQRHDAGRQIARLIALSPLRSRLTSPSRIAIVGPPNVGKSSLTNAIVGFDRSIVFDQPGTTRDVLMTNTAIDGWPVLIIDTAGLRDSDDEVESQGVIRARAQIEAADVVINVVDANAPSWVEDAWHASLQGDATQRQPPVLVVFNKIDLAVPDGELAVIDEKDASASSNRVLRQLAERCLAEQSNELARRLINSSPRVFLSARTGWGLHGLTTAIAQILVPIEPDADEAVPITDWQERCLRDANSSLAHGDLVGAIVALQRALSQAPV